MILWIMYGITERKLKMSLNKNVHLIYGVDILPNTTDKFYDWLDSNDTDGYNSFDRKHILN